MNFRLLLVLSHPLGPPNAWNANIWLHLKTNSAGMWTPSRNVKFFGRRHTKNLAILFIDRIFDAFEAKTVFFSTSNVSMRQFLWHLPQQFSFGSHSNEEEEERNNSIHFSVIGWQRAFRTTADDFTKLLYCWHSHVLLFFFCSFLARSFSLSQKEST